MPRAIASAIGIKEEKTDDGNGTYVELYVDPVEESGRERPHVPSQTCSSSTVIPMRTALSAGPP